jgi:hypothetical protein
MVFVTNHLTLAAATVVVRKNCGGHKVATSTFE